VKTQLTDTQFRVLAKAAARGDNAPAAVRVELTRPEVGTDPATAGKVEPLRTEVRGEVDALTVAARAVAAELHTAGRRVSRDALAAALRAISRSTPSTRWFPPSEVDHYR